MITFDSVVKSKFEALEAIEMPHASYCNYVMQIGECDCDVKKRLRNFLAQAMRSAVEEHWRALHVAVRRGSKLVIGLESLHADFLAASPVREHDDTSCKNDKQCVAVDDATGKRSLRCHCSCHSKKECTAHGPYEGERCPVGMCKQNDKRYPVAPRQSAKQEIVEELKKFRFQYHVGCNRPDDSYDELTAIIRKVEALDSND